MNKLLVSIHVLLILSKIPEDCRIIYGSTYFLYHSFPDLLCFFSAFNNRGVRFHVLIVNTLNLLERSREHTYQTTTGQPLEKSSGLIPRKLPAGV